MKRSALGNWPFSVETPDHDSSRPSEALPWGCDERKARQRRDEEPAAGSSDAGGAGRDEARASDQGGSDGGADEGGEAKKQVADPSDEVVVDDALESDGWWPVEGYGLDRPDLKGSVVGVLHLKRHGGEYADDVDYEVIDGEGRSVPTDFTHRWQGVILPFALEPDEDGRVFGDVTEADRDE